jgi:hypothetical protein
MGKVQLFDRSNIDSLDWPETEDGRSAKAFLEPMINQGTKHFVDNVQTQMHILTINNLVLPLTVNEDNYSNSYVCSPYGHYILYGLEYVSGLKNILSRTSLSLMLKGMGKIFKMGKINKVVIVNNWLFSTDLYPQITEDEIVTITIFLQERFPQHSILFRSIEKYTGKEIYDALEKCKFSFIASRQVFFIRPEYEASFSSRAFKSDLKLLRESQYHEVQKEDIVNGDYARILELYTEVYKDKHSKLNPQFNNNFIQLMMNSSFPYLKAIVKDEHIDAIAGYICRNGVMVAPFLGYDTSVDKKEKLYRLASTTLTLEAKKRNLVFNLSAGASFYKTIRKAEGVLECVAVYHRHLPFYRKFPWIVLRFVANTIGISIIQNYDK